ncbi:MAG TPA: sigma-54 dependent transcriptional regulator [Gemmatimonadaceae bacterium]|nr:sigma-54 dependent transcriptional regulator [Gemmatimonadaceae bacterium]
MATILAVDDDADVTAMVAAFFERGGHQVLRAHTGGEGVELARRHRPDVVLLDPRMPDMTGLEVLERVADVPPALDPPVVVMLTAHGDVELAVEAMQHGADNFLLKPVEAERLGQAAERALERARLRRLNRYLAARRGQDAPVASLGSSPAMRDLGEQIELLAQSDKTTVLLLGESGTGKGEVAAAIHARSPRAERPFVEVNCARLAEPALDAELFGDERPAASTTGPKRGLLEVADGGTLFLDEVADLAPALQPKLLRVLEGQGFRRAGGSDDVRVDVRVVAATSKDLVNEVTAGAFREDLYYRLSVMPVTLPPLRARGRDDLVELVGRLRDALHPQLPGAPPSVSEAALERLLRYPWPGNIRELRNVLERAMIVGRGAPAVLPEHLPPEVREGPGVAGERHVPRSLEEVERHHIERTLRAHNANRTRAAKELGISRATLIKKIREYGLGAR